MYIYHCILISSHPLLYLLSIHIEDLPRYVSALKVYLLYLTSWCHFTNISGAHYPVQSIPISGPIYLLKALVKWHPGRSVVRL